MGGRGWLLLVLLWVTGCAWGGGGHPPAPQELEKYLQLQGVLAGELILSGKVYLLDDLLVPKGSTLVLRPGTTVYVRVAQSTKIDPEYLSAATELLVRGTLRIEGTAQNPVRFLPLSSDAKEVLWSGITLDGSADSSIRGLVIHQAEAGVQCINSSPVIENSQFIGCRYGLIAMNGSSPQIRGNQLLRGEGGLFCWRQSHPLIENNLIRDNHEEGVFVDATSRPRLLGNQIVSNDIGLALYLRDLEMRGDQLRDNKRDLVWLAPARSGERQ